MSSKTRPACRLAFGFVLAWLGMTLASKVASAEYIITDLGAGPLGGSLSIGGVNRSGSSVGTVTGSDGVTTAARIDETGRVIGMGLLPGGTFSQGYGINAQGRVVGTANTVVGGQTVSRAVFGDGPGSLQAIDPLFDERGRASVGGVGSAINDGNQIAGWASFQGGRSLAFRSDAGGKPVSLGTLGGISSQGLGINNNGTVVGLSSTASGATHAFLAEGSGMRDLGTLAGGVFSVARDINDSGAVVGWADSMGATYASMWTEDLGWKVLGSLYGSRASYAYAINEGGAVVGTSLVGGNRSTAFLYTPLNGMLDLNTLISSTSGWSLTSATGINDRGQIVGIGLYNGQSRAFLLSPSDLADRPGVVPEPPAIVLTLIALVGCGAVRATRQIRHFGHESSRRTTIA